QNSPLGVKYLKNPASIEWANNDVNERPLQIGDGK
ncbi:unnamed protein product, partial [marine sediment metagenome]